MKRAPAGLIVALMLTGAAACTDDDDPAAATATTELVATATVATTAPSTTAPSTTAPSSPASPRPGTTAPAAPDTTVPSTECPSLVPGVNEMVLTAGGAAHPVRVFVPRAYAGSPLPVVIDWHGLGSDGPQQAIYTGYEDLADSEGFIVVHPTGVADVAGGPNSWQLFPTLGRDRDDLAFAGALIDRLVADWCADPARVYTTGMSNGGFFTARLICEMADRIAAAVSVAGTYHPDSCHPARHVPYIAIHGTDDKVVPFAGGESILMTPDAPDDLRVFFEHVIPDEFAKFAVDAGCEAATVDSDVGDEVIRHEYPGCDGGTPIIFYEVRAGGHTWPSSPIAALTEGALGHTTDDMDATRDGWEFMSKFTLSSN